MFYIKLMMSPNHYSMYQAITYSISSVTDTKKISMKLPNQEKLEILSIHDKAFIQNDEGKTIDTVYASGITKERTSSLNAVEDELQNSAILQAPKLQAHQSSVSLQGIQGAVNKAL